MTPEENRRRINQLRAQEGTATLKGAIRAYDTKARSEARLRKGRQRAR